MSGPLLDTIGRKHSIFAGIVFTSVGIGMQIASHEWKLFLGGRLINGRSDLSYFSFPAVHWGHLGPGGINRLEANDMIVAPQKLSDLELSLLFHQFGSGRQSGQNSAGSSCASRTALLSLDSSSFRKLLLTLKGRAPLTDERLVAYGTQKIDGKWSYEAVIVLQFVFVAALILGYPFFPESPYYLVKRGQESKAKSSLERIHGRDDPGLIEAELARLQELIRTTRTLEDLAGMDGYPIVQCFKGTNLVYISPNSKYLQDSY